ncbi:hypothetical protein JCM8097_005766 [Rhodosporidiobolus ruineniae]
MPHRSSLSSALRPPHQFFALSPSLFPAVARGPAYVVLLPLLVPRHLARLVHLVHPVPSSSPSRSPRLSAFKPPPPLSGFRQDPDWDKVFQKYAASPDPQRDVPEGMLVEFDDKMLVIEDKFPKAKFHYLILPRDPFPLASGKTLPSSFLNSRSRLLKSFHAVEVLEVLEKKAKEVKRLVERQMQQQHGRIWGIQVPDGMSSHAPGSQGNAQDYGDLLRQRPLRSFHNGAAFSNLGDLKHFRPPRPPPSLAIDTPAYDPSSLRARFLPFPTPPGMSWNAVLEKYAKAKDPEKELPEGVMLQSDEQTLTIFDGYEKAKFHFLVMPRDPFILSSGEKVPSSHLESLSKLLKSDHRVEVLKALEKQAEEVKEMIQDEMLKKEGWVWDVTVGFHANESMRHVHLHVISSDLISLKLKNKKHYNSFHPELGFFLHLHELLPEVEAGVFKLQPSSVYDSLLKDPLRSFYSGTEYANIPKLKTHLEDEWAQRGKKEKERLKRRAEKDEAKRAAKEAEKGGKHGEASATGAGEGDAEPAGKRQKTE